MRRRRSFYVLVAVAYALSVIVALGIARTRGSDIGVLIIVVLASIGSATVAWRFADSTAAALRQAEQGREELALVGRLSAGLSGPLKPAEVANAFLDGIKGALPPSAIATLLQYEESAGAVRILAQQGAAKLPREGISYPIGSLPAGVRTRLIGEQRSYVLDDTASDPEWPAFVAAIPALKGARSFAVMPLVSRARLIGALIVVDPKPNGVGRDQLQLLALLGQYVAGALHNALSIAEADDRADREAVVNRISQRIYSNLDPDAVVRSALEELGTELGVSRVVISGAGDADLTVLHEWHAEGVRPVTVGTHGQLPLSTLAIREGRTIAVRDARVDARLADASLGSHALIEDGTIAAVATPIGLGGQLAGVLALDQVGAPRAWTSQDVRLLEGVAHELRTALEAAQLLVARQRENERMMALHRASALVAAETDPREVVREVLEAA